MKKLFWITICAVTVFSLFDSGVASAMDGWWGGPFGGYCMGRERGWYGARKSVSTPEEARKILKEFFAGEDVIIGTIRDRRGFFEAEIKDKKDELIDVVIVDKHTGRIRSIY
jgi:hypothetical protein